MRKKSEALPVHPLVGKWFHSYEPDRKDVIQWQGQVLAEVPPGTEVMTWPPGQQVQVLAEVPPSLFLVQLYEWFIGEPSTQHLVPLSDMVHWTFYTSNKQMNHAYETYAVRRDREFTDRVN